MSGRDVLGSSGGDHSDYALDSAFSCAAFAKLVLPIRSLADGTTLGNPVCIGLVGTKSLTSTVGNGSLGTDNRFLGRVCVRDQPYSFRHDSQSRVSAIGEGVVRRFARWREVQRNAFLIGLQFQGPREEIAALIDMDRFRIKYAR